MPTFSESLNGKDEYKERLGSVYARLVLTGKLSKGQIETELEVIKAFMQSSKAYKEVMREGAKEAGRKCMKLSNDLWKDEAISDREMTELYTLLIRSHSLGELVWESDLAELSDTEKRSTERNPSTLPVLEL